MRQRFIGVATTLACILSAPTLANADTSGAASFGNPVATVLKLFLFLAIIIVLAVLSIRFLAKKTQVVQRGGIQVLAARQVAPNRSVQVIDVHGKRYLIGVGDQVTLLAEVDEPLEDFDLEENPAEPRSFGRALANALQSVRNQYRSTTTDKEGS